MKIAVYDKTNKERLLGHLEVNAPIRSSLYSVPLLQAFPSSLSPTACQLHEPVRNIIFEVDHRRDSSNEMVDWATQVRTTVQRLCLTTGVELETLMKLDSFYLPGEDKHEAAQRRRFWRNTH